MVDCVCRCPCLIEWLVWFDETEGKRGLTLGVMFSFHAASCTFCSIICA